MPEYTPSLDDPSWEKSNGTAYIRNPPKDTYVVDEKLINEVRRLSMKQIRAGAEKMEYHRIFRVDQASGVSYHSSKERMIDNLKTNIRRCLNGESSYIGDLSDNTIKLTLVEIHTCQGVGKRIKELEKCETNLRHKVEKQALLEKIEAIDDKIILDNEKEWCAFIYPDRIPRKLSRKASEKFVCFMKSAKIEINKFRADDNGYKFTATVYLAKNLKKNMAYVGYVLSDNVPHQFPLPQNMIDAQEEDDVIVAKSLTTQQFSCELELFLMCDCCIVMSDAIEGHNCGYYAFKNDPDVTPRDCEQAVFLMSQREIAKRTVNSDPIESGKVLFVVRSPDGSIECPSEYNDCHSLCDAVTKMYTRNTWRYRKNGKMAGTKKPKVRELLLKYTFDELIIDHDPEKAKSLIKKREQKYHAAYSRGKRYTRKNT